MTTLTPRTAQNTLATLFWAGGRAIHHGTNAYQGVRRLYKNEIASGTLRRDCFAAANAIQNGIDDALEAGDRILNEWQSFSDDLRAILWIFLGPLLALLWGAACDLAMASARLLGRVWGYWMAESQYDWPIALLTGWGWVAGTMRACRAEVRRWVRLGLEGCDRVLQTAFCLA